MPPARARPTSLTILIYSGTLWLAACPPTPRRATYPIHTTKNSSDGAPPIPPLSYWNPDTPSPFSIISPKSPTNPFLSSPAFCPYTLFPTVAPLLPCSPLSIFDQALSPTAPTFLHSRTPSPTKTTFLLPASPLLSPRFLYPRTPPCPPAVGRKASIYDVVLNMAERKGSVASMVRVREAMRLEFFTWLFLKKQREMDRDIGEEGKSVWDVKRLWKRVVGGERKKEEEKGLLKRRRFGAREMKGVLC